VFTNSGYGYVERKNKEMSAGPTGILDLPMDILWLILRDVLNYRMYLRYVMEYEVGVRGYNIIGGTGGLTCILNMISSVHPAFRRCIKRQCVWHNTFDFKGWDFKKGSLRPE
jgi:hypothetical protein